MEKDRTGAWLQQEESEQAGRSSSYSPTAHCVGANKAWQAQGQSRPEEHSSGYLRMIKDSCAACAGRKRSSRSSAKWDCSVRYIAPEYQPPEVGEWSFNFDTGGGTQHVTQSISTVNKYAPAGKTNNASWNGFARR